MSEYRYAWLLRVLRVPAEPAAPAGERVIRTFRAARAYYGYRLAVWALVQFGALSGLVGGLIFGNSAVDFAPPSGFPGAGIVATAIGIAEALATGAYVVQAAFSFAILRLDFDLRWYILSERSLRIREGILSLREKTMTYANIQQISIRQNPLQRLFGIADVEVRSAGGGSAGDQKPHGKSGEPTHVAFFRGVDNAEEVRTAIRERIRLHRDAGLGDPDEPPPLPDAHDPGALAAARELLEEMRLLRHTLERTPHGRG